MVRFLNANMLIRRESVSDVADLGKVRLAGETSWFTWLLHHYLFLRIPLVRPQRFLEATLPLARLFVSHTALILLVLIALLGGYLTLRQWDTYFATFLHFTNPEGLLWYGLALAGAKVFHELGHAYTAANYGCRVPTMGVAFLVMWPVLYTDTSDAWRLTRKDQRLAIGAAGMAVELALAICATLLWSFLPDGPARSAAFIVGTVTWIMTLAVNLNPFMRFDGYYLLSDALDVENLQDRAFAYAKWWLRDCLFGFGEAPPEAFSVGLGRGLIAYAFLTWTYRLFLFLGIAVLVYAFFFKLLGVFLFAVEIIWFIGLPIVREAGEWWKRRDAFRLNRNLFATGICLAAGIGVLVIPWQTTIAVPTVLQASERANVYAPLAARVTSVHVKRGDSILQGDILLKLESPELDHQIAQAGQRIEMSRLQVRREASGGSEAENIRLLQRRLEGEVTVLHGLEAQRALQVIHAPISGRVTDLNTALKARLWVNESYPLIQIAALEKARLNGFVEERDFGSIKINALAVFYPEDPSQPPLPARVTAVAEVNSQVLDIPYLASVHGGDVPVEQGRRGELIPIHGIYRVSMRPEPNVAAPAMVQRGIVHIEGAAVSIITRIWDRVWSVLVRESGF